MLNASRILVLLFISSIVFAQAPDRDVPPTSGPAPVFRLHGFARFKLSNGIPVVLYEKHGIPLVQINAIIRAGSMDEPPGKSGLATMTAAMMTEGAGGRDAFGVHEAIDYLGADLAVSAGYSTTGVTLNTPVGKLDSALAVMADVMRRPTFPPDELERKRKESLTALLEWRDEPRALASVLFSHLVYGSHPYGRLLIGTAQSIAAFTVADLKQFHAEYFGADKATFVAAGDIDPAALKEKLERAFGSWGPAQPSTAVPLAPVQQVESRRVYLVDKPGAEQSVIRIGCIGAARNTEDFYPLVVMNTVLGGSFSARLNHNLRETHGYTYGAGSEFDFRVEAGPFIASSSVQTPVTDSSLIEFMKELRAIREPIPDAEVKKARQYVALGYPSGFQTVGEIAGEMDDMVVFHLPESYFNDYIGKVLSVTEQQAHASAMKYIDPDKLVIVVVGDLAKIKDKIDALKLGPVSVVTVDEILGAAPALDR